MPWLGMSQCHSATTAGMPVSRALDLTRQYLEALLRAAESANTGRRVFVLASHSCLRFLIELVSDAVNSGLRDRFLPEEDPGEVAERLSEQLFSILVTLPPGIDMSVPLTLELVEDHGDFEDTNWLAIVPVEIEEDRTIDGQLAGTTVTRAAIADYLSSAPLALSARGQVPDRFDAAAPRIPIGYRTDGVWVWSIEAERYVARHGMPLPDELVDRIVRLGAPPPVSEDIRHQAVEVLKASSGESKNNPRTETGSEG